MTKTKKQTRREVGAKGLGLATLLLLAAACQRALLPQPIPLDRVNCARCAMLVSDTASGAEVVFTDSDPLYYDDVGCLASAEIKTGEPFELWVEVDGGSSWKKAREAFYAKPADSRTPMGYGVIAFSSSEKARARDKEGRAWSWKEIQRESLSRGESPKRAADKAGA